MEFIDQLYNVDPSSSNDKTEKIISIINSYSIKEFITIDLIESSENEFLVSELYEYLKNIQENNIRKRRFNN